MSRAYSMFEYIPVEGPAVSVKVDIQVREARPSDFDAIRVVATAAIEEFRVALGEPVYQAYLTDVLQVEVRARHATIFLAEMGGEICGTVSLYHDISDEGLPLRYPPGTAGIRANAVMPGKRGHGIGAEMLRAVIARARGHGAGAIALHTATCMTTATRLYERQGFGRSPEYDFVVNEYFGVGEGEALEALGFVLWLDETNDRDRGAASSRATDTSV